jgi:hypothetical protein
MGEEMEGVVKLIAKCFGVNITINSENSENSKKRETPTSNKISNSQNNTVLEKEKEQDDVVYPKTSKTFESLFEKRYNENSPFNPELNNPLAPPVNIESLPEEQRLEIKRMMAAKKLLEKFYDNKLSEEQIIEKTFDYICEKLPEVAINKPMLRTVYKQKYKIQNVQNINFANY